MIREEVLKIAESVSLDMVARIDESTLLEFATAIAADERAVSDKLLEAMKLAVFAMRAPIDGWKGELERKALDAARLAIAEVEAMRKKQE